jgi:hypothetical protein
LFPPLGGLDLPSPAPEVAEYIAIKGERAKR